jgi:hypothetical protein
MDVKGGRVARVSVECARVLGGFARVSAGFAREWAGNARVWRGFISLEPQRLRGFRANRSFEDETRKIGLVKTWVESKNSGREGTWGFGNPAEF